MELGILDLLMPPRSLQSKTNITVRGSQIYFTTWSLTMVQKAWILIRKISWCRISIKYGLRIWSNIIPCPWPKRWLGSVWRKIHECMPSGLIQPIRNYKDLGCRAKSIAQKLGRMMQVSGATAIIFTLTMATKMRIYQMEMSWRKKHTENCSAKRWREEGKSLAWVDLTSSRKHPRSRHLLKRVQMDTMTHSLVILQRRSYMHKNQNLLMTSHLWKNSVVTRCLRQDPPAPPMSPVSQVLLRRMFITESIWKLNLGK